MNSNLDVALIQLKILGVMIQCENFQKKHPRYPSGAIVDGKPVGGQFMPKDSTFSVKEIEKEIEQNLASDKGAINVSISLSQGEKEVLSGIDLDSEEGKELKGAMESSLEHAVQATSEEKGIQSGVQKVWDTVKETDSMKALLDGLDRLKDTAWLIADTVKEHPTETVALGIIVGLAAVVLPIEAGMVARAAGEIADTFNGKFDKKFAKKHKARLTPIGKGIRVGVLGMFGTGVAFYAGSFALSLLQGAAALGEYLEKAPEFKKRIEESRKTGTSEEKMKEVSEVLEAKLVALAEQGENAQWLENVKVASILTAKGGLRKDLFYSSLGLDASSLEMVESLSNLQSRFDEKETGVRLLKELSAEIKQLDKDWANYARDIEKSDNDAPGFGTFANVHENLSRIHAKSIRDKIGKIHGIYHDPNAKHDYELAKVIEENPKHPEKQLSGEDLKEYQEYKNRVARLEKTAEAKKALAKSISSEANDPSTNKKYIKALSELKTISTPEEFNESMDDLKAYAGYIGLAENVDIRNLLPRSKDEFLAEEIAFASNKEQVDEVLAKRLAYRLDSGREPNATKSFLEKNDIEVLDVIQNKDTGFAVALLRQGKTSFVDFVGSNDAKDWQSNLTPGAEVGRDQFEANRADILKLLKEEKEKGQNVRLLGHSLGGALAQIAVSEFPDLVDEVEVYNPAGIKASTQAKFLEANPNIPVTIHIHEYDPVSRAGEKLIPGKVKFYQTQQGFFDPHRGIITAPSPQIKEAPTPKWLQKKMEPA